MKKLLFSKEKGFVDKNGAILITSLKNNINWLPSPKNNTTKKTHKKSKTATVIKKLLSMANGPG